MPPRAGPTHFLCIPLASAQLRRSLATFQADVTSINSFALPNEAIRPPGTLHLTLGVMSLQRQDQLDKALSLLRRLRLTDMLADARNSLAARHRGPPTKLPTGPLNISMTGVQAMHSPSKTGVLYAPPLDSEGGTLYEFCKRLKQRFIDEGLMIEDGKALLLHATVVNTIHVKTRGRQRLELDARDIIGKYEDFVWVDSMEVGQVAICRMGAKAVGVDAYYEAEAEVNF